MPDESIWSNTEYATSQTTDGHAALDPMVDGAFTVEFDSRPLDSPWNFLAQPNVSSVVEPIAVSSPNLVLDIVGTLRSCIDF